MSEDFQHLEFHKFQKPEVKSNKVKNRDVSAFVGLACLVCEDTCPGFSIHSWRAGCSSCKCALWRHDLPSDAAGKPLNRLGVDEPLPPLISEYDKALTEGFMWVPRGLRTSQIDIYMRHFPKELVPKVNSEGSKNRARNMLHQIPESDYHVEAAKNLTDSGRTSFFEIGKKRIDEALGVGAVRGAMSSSAKCSGCGEGIRPGNMAVFANKIDDQNCWHPQCFKCCVDDTILVDSIYFAHEKNLYCGRHWAEQHKPRCYGCEELIYIGEYTKAMDKAWHTHHFCCFQCDQQLTGEKYVIINHHPYCQSCYNNTIANTCYACNQIIGPESKDMFVKDRHYHKKCLVCTQCTKPLESQTFSFINSHAVCHNCRGVDPEKSQYCHLCNELFHVEEKKVGVSNEYYHEKCFLCSQCEKAIGSQKFIRKSDGRKLCNDCFEVSARKCGTCDNLIKGSTVKFEEQAYHTECFVCTNCNKQLGGVQFYKNDADPFCEDCYLSSHAKRCASCYQPIEGNTKFIDYDRKYWHSKCFICTKCEQGLAGAKFVVRDGNRFCVACK